MHLFKQRLETTLSFAVIFANVQTSTKRVSKVDNINSIILDIFMKSHEYYLTLDTVLKKANVNLRYSKDKILCKDDILKLFE
jgi:hypothetical protein